MRIEAITRKFQTPAQLYALIVGVWFILNGVLSLIGDANFGTGDNVHGNAFGLAPTNGWHGLFHLVPGLIGVAIARNRVGSLIYAFAVGGIYVAAAFSGLFENNIAFGLIITDVTGNFVHLAEGLTGLVSGALTVAWRSRLKSTV